MSCISNHDVGSQFIIQYKARGTLETTEAECSKQCFSENAPYAVLYERICYCSDQRNQTLESLCACPGLGNSEPKHESALCQHIYLQDSFRSTIGLNITSQIQPYRTLEEVQVLVETDFVADRLRWDFGDNSSVLDTSAGQASHFYTVFGVYRVSISAEYGQGVETVCVDVHVLEPVDKASIQTASYQDANNPLQASLQVDEGSSFNVHWSLATSSGGQYEGMCQLFALIIKCLLGLVENVVQVMLKLNIISVMLIV